MVPTNKFAVNEEVWMEHIRLGSIKVKVITNETKIEAAVGNNKMALVHAYLVESVEEIEGQKRKWPLVPETILRRNF